jgi:hypothetical protein
VIGSAANRKRLRVFGSAWAALALSGCAWWARPGDDVSPPWRIAEVSSIDPRAAEARTATRDCVGAPEASGAASSVAVLSYHDGSRYMRRPRTARVPATPGLHVGDRVRFNTLDCRAPIVPLTIERPA